MIKITDRAKCCGCTACFNVCPAHCISMKADTEGFMYPEIDPGKCVGCGLCEKACPVLHGVGTAACDRVTYAVRVSDRSTLMDSTSGGLFTPLADYVLSQDGEVVAAAYDSQFQVKHMVIRSTDDRSDLARFRGSKYVQSDLNDCFAGIKASLKNSKTVLFVGTTCQVSGLKAYLGKEYDRLYTVDLVCHGVPSPKLWKSYLAYHISKAGAPVAHVSFRSKKFGYHRSGTMQMTFENGKVYAASGRTDLMLKAFFSEIASRPSCYSCPFKKLERCSDLTLYDCWHYSELTGLPDDDCGYTNVIVQSAKGMELLEKIAVHCEMRRVDTEKAIELDGSMVRNSAISHPERNAFYTDLEKEPLPRHIQRFIPIRTKDRLLALLKPVLYKVKALKR